MTTLWDTSGGQVVAALSAERRAQGAVASGLVLTLVTVCDESAVQRIEQAAIRAASQHPCRLLIVVRRALEATSRLDAEVSVGGRLGPGEAVVMRMSGRLGLHAESVVLPLLASDCPVVTWWSGATPDLIAHDPLGVLADRRVTDVSNDTDVMPALLRRARDYVPGDTDLAWTRTTPWRGVLAGAYDAIHGEASGARVAASERSPSGALLAAWLGGRLGLQVDVDTAPGTGIQGVRIEVDGGQDAGGTSIALVRDTDRAGTLSRTGEPDRTMPLPRDELGDLLAEELRRLDDDPVYAAALGRVAGLGDLAGQTRDRTHVWRDPAEQAEGNRP